MHDELVQAEWHQHDRANEEVESVASRGEEDEHLIEGHGDKELPRAKPACASAQTLGCGLDGDKARCMHRASKPVHAGEHVVEGGCTSSRAVWCLGS